EPQRVGAGGRAGRRMGPRGRADGEHPAGHQPHRRDPRRAGFPQMMDAEQYVIDNHLASIISQSFAAAEETFSSQQSLENLRHAFKAAPAAGVTILGSSGDGGAANNFKEPVHNPAPIPTASVEWPASDPLVTGV